MICRDSRGKEFQEGDTVVMVVRNRSIVVNGVTIESFDPVFNEIVVGEVTRLGRIANGFAEMGDQLECDVGDWRLLGDSENGWGSRIYKVEQ